MLQPQALRSRGSFIGAFAANLCEAIRQTCGGFPLFLAFEQFDGHEAGAEDPHAVLGGELRGDLWGETGFQHIEARL